jgi:2-polyprenyl-3-methyl-5-hydroxy-6-metoxy-1,4-benzoquinol methylase
VTNARLIQHYNAKYSAEAEGGGTLKPLPLRQPCPVDRFSAAIAHLESRLPAGADILELGAGDGLIAESLRAGGVEFGTYTIGDMSDSRIEGLKRNLTDPRFRFAQANAEEPSASVEGPYDAVIMVALIEHLIDPIGAMADIRRLLRPGGFAYIDTPNVAKWTYRMRLLVGRFPSTASRDEGLTSYGGDRVDLLDEGHLHYFTYRSLSRMLTEQCGFSSVDRLAYFVNVDLLTPRLGSKLARVWPALFSELACIAYA